MVRPHSQTPETMTFPSSQPTQRSTMSSADELCDDLRNSGQTITHFCTWLHLIYDVLLAYCTRTNCSTVNTVQPFPYFKSVFYHQEQRCAPFSWSKFLVVKFITSRAKKCVHTFACADVSWRQNVQDVLSYVGLYTLSFPSRNENVSSYFHVKDDDKHS
jgi:hypothetical protein